MRIWKTLVLSGVILAAAGTAVGIMMNQAPEPEKADATETEWRIESARVEAGFYQPEIRLVGRLEARRQQTFTAAFSAEVMELTVTEGDRVQAGDLLLRLDDFDTRQQRQQAEADLADIESQRQIRQLQQRLDTQALAVAIAKLEQLQEQLTKQQQLVTRGLAPQQNLDDLQQQVDQQQLSVLQHRTTIDSHPAELARLDASHTKLQLSLERADRAQAETEVRAPFAGRVASVAVHAGETTQAGQPLLTLYSDDAMQLKVQLPHSLAGQEQSIGARLTQGERQTELRFDRAQAQMSASQSGFTAWFDLTDSAGWLPGGYARVTVQLPSRFSYRVPEAAVFQDGWVYRIDDDRRLQAEAVDILGINQADDRRWLIVQGPDLAGDLRLLTTRLTNPMTGMLVHEPGVDPDPEPAVDDSADQPAGVNP